MKVTRMFSSLAALLLSQVAYTQTPVEECEVLVYNQDWRFNYAIILAGRGLADNEVQVYEIKGGSRSHFFSRDTIRFVANDTGTLIEFSAPREIADITTQGAALAEIPDFDLDRCLYAANQVGTYAGRLFATEQCHANKSDRARMIARYRTSRGTSGSFDEMGRSVSSPAQIFVSRSCRL